MELTRRRALATGAAVATGTLGGCTRLNPLSGGDTDGGGGGGGGGSTTTTSGGTPTPEPTATPAVSRSGTATDRVFEEVEWFGRDLRPTVERYLSWASRALGLLESLDERSSVSARDLDRLRSLFDDLEAVLYDRIAPHFGTEPSVRSYNAERVSELRTLRGRADWDAVQRVLAGMVERYETLASESWVARTFPTDPVQGRLAEVLTADGRAADAATLVYYAPTDYLVRVQRDAAAYAGELAGDRDDLPGYDRTFDPTSVAAYRTARAYVTYNHLGRGPRAVPVFVQQYEDEARAGSAVDRMLSQSGAVSADGTRTLGGQDWRRVFYQANGGVTYAFVLRTGRYVLVTAPSRTPWDEREDGWTAPLSLGWFW
jgi:hypothetical protein